VHEAAAASSIIFFILSVVDWSLVVVPSSIHSSFSLLHAELLFYMLYLVPCHRPPELLAW
jgi:hypothetical protein